jgi:1-acyl-sn-glycerol-3-phosphate acyltransferase
MSKKVNHQNNGFLARLARAIMKLIGWQILGEFPDLPKYVLVGAPHTSNWDFPLIMLWMFASGVRFNWIGKDTLFSGPLGPLYYKLGGIPVRRDRHYNFVDQIVDVFNSSERLIIAIAPEGTRGKTTYWKSGFYYMATGAGVPVVLGFIDFSRKQVGIGPTFEPSGDIHADFGELREFYAEKKGLYPQKQGTIRLHPENEDDRQAPGTAAISEKQD